uniref:C-type lectin domain-containing protein n=1 Tax=Chelydra serpentina TaxID=8475 RepID=A0A8C3XI18_CHESE
MVWRRWISAPVLFSHKREQKLKNTNKASPPDLKVSSSVLVVRCQPGYLNFLTPHMKSPPESQLPHVSTPAQGKCYYFSEAEGTWDSSQSLCASLNASLAEIDTQKDLTFIMRYKGISEYWIGLKRVSARTWQWVNGEQFNDLFTVRGEGDCAYLSDGFAASSWCSTKRYWICSKPDGMRREDAMPGD